MVLVRSMRFKLWRYKKRLILLVFFATVWFKYLKYVTSTPKILSNGWSVIQPNPNIQHWWKFNLRRPFIIEPPLVDRSLGPPGRFSCAQTISKMEILNNDIAQEDWTSIPDDLTFSELAKIDDRHWKLPINAAVFNLYPQAVNLKKLVRLVKRDRITPIEPIFNETLRYLRLPNNVCGRNIRPGREKVVVVIVKSGVYNFHNRQVLREAYRGQVNKKNSEISMVFSVGLPRKAGGRVFSRDGFVVTLPERAGDALDYYQTRPLEVLTRLKQETELNHDLVIGDYEDTYYNLTLKMLHSFQWASRLCTPLKPTFVFMDDDFAFKLDKLKQIISHRSESTRGRMAIGVLRRVSDTIRHGKATVYEKWSVSKREVPWPHHAPHTSGAFYMLGYEIVEELAAGMYFTAPLSLDDVWLGTIATKLGISYEEEPGMYQSFNPRLHHRQEALFLPFEVLFRNPLRWVRWTFEPVSKVTKV